MTLSIIYSADAIADLASTARYLIYQAGDTIATATLKRMRRRIESLTLFPASNPLVPEAGANIRRVIVGSYLILYRVEESSIVVVRVLHTSRDVSAALMRRSAAAPPA